MQVVNASDRWNPFSWRAAELAALGDDPSAHARRDELMTELALAEADEAARGARHLAVAHGTPGTVPECEHLAEFYDLVRDMTSKAEWSRLRGSDDHLIVAVVGPAADECIARLSNIAASMNPGHWRISHSACPDLRGLAASS